jgi:MYXO-CTERM domain-containing protein
MQLPPMTRITLAGVALLAALAVRANVAEACSCVPPPEPRLEMQRSGAVFVGTVTSIEPVGAAMRVELSVERSFKGARDGAFTVRTAGSAATCGFPFAEGERYLVYAWRPPDGDEHGVSLCSRSRPLDLAGDDVAALEALLASADGAHGSGDPDEDAQGAPLAPAAPETAPRAGGCAGCAAGSHGPPWGAAVLGLLVLGTLTRAPRRRRAKEPRR